MKSMIRTTFHFIKNRDRVKWSIAMVWVGFTILGSAMVLAYFGQA